MTSRPSFTSSKRPLSAIFLGSLPTNNVPDLPEPPSPGAESDHSGLPSPPATNSTGSGSTGDDTTNAGSIRQRPVSLSNSTMSNGNYAKTFHALRRHKNGGIEEDEDEDDENQNDEDNTAKMDIPHHIRSSSENVLALQRVKSLTQRNRMAINKLSSFSRLKTPSPISHSPAPPPTASSSASSSSNSSSSRVSSHSHSHLVSHRDDYHEYAQSGSETERENPSTTSSSNHSVTPSPSVRASSVHGFTRQRRISAPDSPSKGVLRSGSGSPTWTRAPRKRASMAVSENIAEHYEERDRDVTAAALAAVASSRRSPTIGGKRTRQPLPQQFRDDQREKPSTPYLERVSFSNQQQSLSGPRQYRSSVRGLNRQQTRWLSEDLRSSISADREADEDHLSQSGTRQTHRGGSAESPLTGRSLIGEGLRAAGLTKKREDDDVFERVSSTGGSSELGRGQRQSPTMLRNGGGAVGWAVDANADERDRERSRSQASGLLNSRLGEGSRAFDPRTPDNGAASKRGAFNGSASRPATSMADYHHGEDLALRSRTATLVSRTYKSAYPLPERERDKVGAGSALDRHPTPPQHTQQDRQYSSPLGSRRNNMTPLPSGSNSTPQQQQQCNTSEHTRLMMESLSMFESHLSRMPPMGSTSTVTIPELFRSAQGIVHTSDKLNAHLRSGTNKALEEQINAEVGDAANGVELAEVWQKVGSEYREGLRVSDELVRTLTGFILGVGKVLRDTTALASGTDVRHGRTHSLDDEYSRQLSPDVGGGGGGSGSGGRRSVEGRKSSDGRRSVESRRSWEPLSRDQVHADALKRLSGRVETRSPSVNNSVSNPERDLLAPTPPVASRAGNASTSSWMRRLVTPREEREQRQDANEGVQNHEIPASDSLDTLRGYEPSPTPLSRQPRVYLPDRTRTLPPISIPPPLPALPSESAIRRSNTTGKNTSNRRKASNTSNITVRANPMGMPPFSAISTPTTALTPHTVSTPERSSFPLLRSVSARSGVTFSKPSTVSVSALSGVQQQQQQRDNRKRTISSTSSNGNEPSSSTPAPSGVLADVRIPATPLSGSETERDTRRKTVGARSRISLDNTVHANSRDNGATRGHAANPARRERRRTITEIFSQT